MKQCFGYVRVSTQKQGEGVSLEAQRTAIEQFALGNNITIVEWFEEKQTAAKSGRPVFGAMLGRLRRGEVAGVVMHKIDRSARNFADWAKIGDLADAGVDVHFATESLDFRSRGGRLCADIQAVIAADYVRNLRDECLKGMNGRLKQGLYPWGAPLGYQNNGKGKPKTPDAKAPLICQAFELYGSGAYSIRSLQLEMVRRGLRSRLGNPVSKHGIETVLSNPFYCGIIKMRSTGAVYPGCHEPLISPSLFARVKDIRAGKTTTKKVTRHSHLFQGLFRCDFCSYAMIPERQKGRVYYRCHTPSCPTTSVREDEIEEKVLSLLESAAFSHEQIELLNCHLVDTKTRDSAEGAIQAKQLQLAQLEQRRERLTDALIDRLIDQAAFNSRKETLTIEQHRLAEDIAHLQNATSTGMNLQKFLEQTKNLALLYRSCDRAEKRQIVELTTSNRVVRLKELALEPQMWLQTLGDTMRVSTGAHHRPSNRTFTALNKVRLKALVEASKSEGAVKLCSLIERMRSSRTSRSIIGQGGFPTRMPELSDSQIALSL